MFSLARDGTLHFHPAADLDAAVLSAVRIEAEDRAGLERLLRYCARPALASERLAWDGPDQPVRCTLPRPLPSGQTELTLTPLELLDRLAALIPPPRRRSPLRSARETGPLEFVSFTSRRRALHQPGCRGFRSGGSRC